MKLIIPDPALVLLTGVAGCGKSTFARRHFRATEILSSDFFRGLIADDEGDQTVTTEAFQALHLIADGRLHHRRLTVVDATNVQRRARRPLLRLARRHGVPAAAIVFNLPESICLERAARRADRQVSPAVIHEQFYHLQRSLLTLPHEGFQSICFFNSPDEIENAVIERIAESAGTIT
ncbi:MAG TPA: AAA family ATPase [Blastocatellia bacterium]|nr:AAA family ATPase [Blastocatellia bacterium]